MPLPPPPTVIFAHEGGVVAVVRVNQTVDVWHIPRNAVITVQPQVGFGSPTESSVDVSLDAALTDIVLVLGQDGAE